MLSIVLLPTVQILAFALPPLKGRAFIFVPLILGLAYLTLSTHPPRQVPPALLPHVMPIALVLIHGRKAPVFHPEREYGRQDKPKVEAVGMSSISTFAGVQQYIAVSAGFE